MTAIILTVIWNILSISTQVRTGCRIPYAAFWMRERDRLLGAVNIRLREG